MNQIYDVAIIGAGPGGSSAASYLAQAGARVLLLDKADFPRDKTCGDAVSPNALKIAGDLGLMDKLREFSYRINGIRLVAPNGGDMAAPIPTKSGFTNYVYISPRLQLDNLLLEKAIQSGADFESRIRITDIQVDRDRVTLKGKNQRGESSFSARVAVIAVGASIPLLLKTGIMAAAPPVALAARGYFTGVQGLQDLMEIRFDGVPLPGYGWIFPTSETSANIGAGFMKNSPNLSSNVREVLDDFLHHEPIANMLAESQRVGAIKSYPLRMDFATAKTYADRLLVVGEAAGLVNPFTGEGIDYAMESGAMAAEVLIEQLAKGELSAKSLKRYNQKLRGRFQSLFVWTMRMRGLYMNDWLLNPLVRAAKNVSSVEKIILEVLLSYRNPVQALAPRTLYHVLRNWKEPH
jgi:menaquinone-9 beta-reductase